MKNKRVGFYLWAGPGTIRMLNLKYFNPKIDIGSLMESYNYDYLARAKEILDLTDVWVSYSWGFSDKHERDDHEFLISKLNNFKKLKLRVHAYVQGPNVVYDDFKDKNWFAKDEKGRLVSYHRGRKVICVNNPEYREFVLKRINTLKNIGVDGVFIDNIQMGQLGVCYDGKSVNFCGCNCDICKNLFYGNIPENSSEYLKFRSDSLIDFLLLLKKEVSKNKLEFGGNCYDPRLNLKVVTGLNLKRFADLADYLLFENHSFPAPHRLFPNEYIDKLTYSLKKPIFLVSYKKGIGHDSQFTQIDFENLVNEDSHLRFHACIKGSEYKTRGRWHNLHIYDLTKIKKRNLKHIAHLGKIKQKKPILKHFLIRWLVKNHYNPAMNLYFENKRVRKIFFSLEKKILTSGI